MAGAGRGRKSTIGRGISVGRGIAEWPGSLAPNPPLMTWKKPLPLLGTQWDQGPERLRGARVGPQRVVGSGLGPGRGRDWRALTLPPDPPACSVASSCPPPPAGSLAPTTTPGEHRAATLLLSHHPVPIPLPPKPLQPELGERSVVGRGAGQATQETAAPCPIPTNQPWIPLDTPGAHRPPL